MRTKQEIEDRVNKRRKELDNLYYVLENAENNSLYELALIEEIQELKIELEVLKWVLNK